MKTQLVIDYDKLKEAMERTKIKMHEEFKDGAFYSESLIHFAMANLKYQIIDDLYLGTSAAEAIDAGARDKDSVSA